VRERFDRRQPHDCVGIVESSRYDGTIVGVSRRPRRASADARTIAGCEASSISASSAPRAPGLDAAAPSNAAAND
jgi:hypothetical protein